jgi:hypothetical protein
MSLLPKSYNTGPASRAVLDWPRQQPRTQDPDRALAQLYDRRDALDELIRSIEDYQRMRETRARCIPFSALPKCS